MRDFFSGVGMVVMAGGAIAAVTFGSFFGYKYFAPRYEGVRRDVMIESRSYSEGTVRELYTIKRQYDVSKSEEEKATLAAAARHEFSIFPKERLPLDLQAFLQQIGN